MATPPLSAPDRYAVIGFPVQHSWSPFIHGMFAKQTGQDLSYTRMEIAPENMHDEVADFFALGGKGLNVTVPHKQAVCSLARHLTPRAQMAGAVNTLALREDGLLGDNTDGAGLVTDLTRNLGLSLENLRILLLGAGGAARGVLGPLLATAPQSICIANRKVERAAELVGEFNKLGSLQACAFDAIGTAPFDLIINATAASLQDAVPPIPSTAIAATTLCYDMAYGKGGTAFTRWAKQSGAARAETGWGMLVEQAAESFLLWRGVKPDTKPVIEAVKSQR